MEAGKEEMGSCCPRAAEGLWLMCAGSVVSNLGNQMYFWGIAPQAGMLVIIAGSILQAVGLYRAGADEPGFYRALLYLFVSVSVNYVRGYLQMDFYYISLLVYVAVMLLALRAANLACAAACRLLCRVGNGPLAELGGIVAKLNIVCYAANVIGGLMMAVGSPIVYLLYLTGGLLTVVYMVFLFLAGRALRHTAEGG